MSISLNWPLRRPAAPAVLLTLAAVALLILGGCAPGAGAVPTPTRTPRPTAQPYVLATLALDLPAATRAPGAEPASQAESAAAPPAAALVTATPAAAAQAEPGPAPTEPPVPPTATAAPEAQLTVSSDTANARGGPSTSFPIVGRLTGGQALPVTGKNAAGDWWQVCCVDGQKAWVAASLVQVENPGVAPVVEAEGVAAPEPAAEPAQPARPAPAAKATPRPAATDPCANIGGDGCKWKVTGGPTTADNGGQELKLQLFFIHSGIDGGQPQGSYFVVLEKDGQRLAVPDSVRSVAQVSSQGTLGKFNYEYALTANRLPGNTIAGNYTLWVLDGTGERDSRNVNFTISGNQGLLWIQFDQA